jgi:glutamate decarboxylase
LIFHVSYLGGDHPTFQLNFSRGASQVIAQYYNFIRLGKNGYKSVMESLSSTAKWISTALGGMGYFDIVHSGNDLPVVCIKVKDGKSFDVFQISDLLKQRGWIVPAYAMAPNAQDVSVLRIVVREGLSLDLAQLLIRDIDQVVTTFESQKGTMASTTIAKPTDRSDKALMMNTDSLRLHKIHRGVC